MNGGAFGVRVLGTALVVNAIIRDFPDNRAIPQSAVAGPKPWTEVQRQTRIKEWTTKAVPSTRTPKAVASLWLLHLFLKDHRRRPKLTGSLRDQKTKRRNAKDLGNDKNCRWGDS